MQILWFTRAVPVFFNGHRSRPTRYFFLIDYLKHFIQMMISYFDISKRFDSTIIYTVTESDVTV